MKKTGMKRARGEVNELGKKRRGRQQCEEGGDGEERNREENWKSRGGEREARSRDGAKIRREEMRPDEVEIDGRRGGEKWSVR